MKSTTLGNDIATFYYKHFTLSRACYLVTLVQSYRIFCKFEFHNVFGKLPQNCLNGYNPFLHHAEALDI